MLLRVLEPEVMDSAAEARDYDAMDHREVNVRFAADLLALGSIGTRVLDVGTGTAQIPIALCRQSTGATVVAVDASRHMIELARANVDRAGLADRIFPELCDAKALPFPDGAFDAVISNSIVHHIPRPEGVLAEMVRVARPGGLLFVRDLARPPDVATLQRLVEQYSAGANEHQRRMFANSLHAALTVAEVRDLLATLGHDPQGVRLTSDRHWTWTARRA